MEFSSAKAIEQIVWQMRLADYPRSKDRARIDSLANGAPPYAEDEAARNGIEVNVNDLSLARLSHDARMQLYQAFNKPGNFFRMTTDCGSSSRRSERGVIVTKLLNRYLKRSDQYFEVKRSKFAQLVLHGRGPAHWSGPDKWQPTCLPLADVLMPARTLLTFENLPFFAVFRSYTAHQLKQLTRGVKKGNNPGWNMRAVNNAIDWAVEQTSKLYGGTTWQEYWSPEKAESRFQDDSGIYASDLAQTIDLWDFYYWSDEGGEEGWRRRMIFDAYGGYSGWYGDNGYGEQNKMPDKNLLNKKSTDKGFVFSSGSRPVATKTSEIVHFQFADLAATAPFTYHGVRSMGWMLYAVCHLQNRLRCRFSEAVFENLLMYMRVNSLDDAERALKIQIANRGIIDPSVQFLPPNERWQPDANLAMIGLSEFKQIIDDNSSSYTQNQNLSRDRVEKTKFQVMAEVQAMQTMVNAGLQHAYRYERSEDEEIVRRFFRKQSKDADVRDFQARAIAQGIPESMMNAETWDVEPEKIYGAGNKTMEMAIAQQLMEWRGAYTPQAQQIILRKATLAITDDAAESEMLVPTHEGISDTRHDAMVAFGSMMAGALVKFTKAHDELEVVTVLIAELGRMVTTIVNEGGMAEPSEINGFYNVLGHIGPMLASISQDEAREEQAKQLGQTTGKIANEVKGLEQRLAEKMKAEEKNGDGEMAKTMGKVQSMQIESAAKAANTRESHAQRTAQRQAQYELEMQQKERKHQQDLIHQADQHAMDLAAQEENRGGRENTDSDSGEA